MRLNTDQPSLLAELIEESKFFVGAEDLDVNCIHIENGEFFIDKITIGEKVYEYKNSHGFRSSTSSR